MLPHGKRLEVAVIGEALQLPGGARRRPVQALYWLLLVGLGAVLLVVRARLAALDLFLLAGAAMLLIGVGLHWRRFQVFAVAVGLLAGAALTLYAFFPYAGSGGEVGVGSFLLLSGLSFSRAGLLWMEVLLPAAVLLYALARRPAWRRLAGPATVCAWSGTALGAAALLVRWRESYLLDPGAGHVPISNLYEVFVLFCVGTTLLYLYLEERYRLRALGDVLLAVVAGAALFLLWYTFARQADAIQPLVPALRSYWMKLHVPANFLGYGCFSLGAALGVARLLNLRGDPGPRLLDDLQYRVIGLGFISFTAATILGAMWAAEAWGGYWSWDPKETWALIVWLNYAAWLHLRMSGRAGPRFMAGWSVVGFFLTLFAFLGVNLYLSGLHSYGSI